MSPVDDSRSTSEQASTSLSAHAPASRYYAAANMVGMLAPMPALSDDPSDQWNANGDGSRPIAVPDQVGLAVETAVGPWIEAVDYAPRQSVSVPDQLSYNLNPLYDFAADGGYHGPALGNLSTNWMSPDYSNTQDWDQRLASSCATVEPGNFGFSFTSAQSALQVAQTNLVVRSSSPNMKQPSPSLLQGVSEVGQRHGPGPPQEQLEQHGNDHMSNMDHLDVASVRSMVESVSSTPTKGRYYVDGDGGRAPFGGVPMQGRTSLVADGITRKDHHSPASASHMDTSSPETAEPTTSSSSGLVADFVSGETYGALLQGLEAESRASLLRGFDMASFPNQIQVAEFSRLYFEKFNTLFPFLRKKSFLAETKSHWVLLLAVAAVGSKYISGHEIRDMRDMMSDLLQQVGTKYLRNLSLQDCEGSWLSPVADGNARSSDLATLQCGILNTICMFHSGNSELVSRALADRYYLVEACSALHLLSPADWDGMQGSASEPSVEHWLKVQSLTRTGMMIWVGLFINQQRKSSAADYYSFLIPCSASSLGADACCISPT